MNYLRIVLNVLKNINPRVLLIAAVLGLAGFSYYQYAEKQKYKQKAKIHEHNIAAIKDSARYYKDKAGNLGVEKLALQVDLAGLQLSNMELAKELEKEKGKVKTITKVRTVIKHDTIEVDSQGQRIGKDEYKIDWSYKDSGDGWSKNIAGYTSFNIDSSSYDIYNSYTAITKDSLNLSITTGIKEVNGKNTVFVKSSYPGIDFVEINGAIIDNSLPSSSKDKRWGLGLSAGYGFNGTKFQPVLMAGITYDIIQW